VRGMVFRLKKKSVGILYILCRLQCQCALVLALLFFSLLVFLPRVLMRPQKNQGENGPAELSTLRTNLFWRPSVNPFCGVQGKTVGVWYGRITKIRKRKRSTNHGRQFSVYKQCTVLVLYCNCMISISIVIGMRVGGTR